MELRRSFYQFLMTLRNPNSHEEVAEFANNAFYDHSFPKQERDYDTISRYLELNGGYLSSMTIFDQAYQMYLDSEA